MTDPPAQWPAFMSEVRARLEKGRDEYQDRGFNRPPAELLGELHEEALDLAGWGFVLWHRIETLRGRVDDGDREVSG